MPLVVSSLTGDASDVFDWILSLNHGEPFREQRNMIENLRQKPNEAAIDFLIRVGTSVSNLAKDWKDELTEGELQTLQYKVSLNGVKEEIRHVLDSEMAKRDGHLTPQQMYEAVKRYETYVAQIRGLMVRVQVPLPVSRRPLVRPQATSLGSTRQQHSLPQLVDQMMRPVALKIPRLTRILTPRRLSLLTRKMRGCTSLITLRRLYQTILFCKLGWLVLCESRR